MRWVVDLNKSPEEHREKKIRNFCKGGIFTTGGIIVDQYNDNLPEGAILCLDVECTIFQKGNPFSPNKLVYVGLYDPFTEIYDLYSIEYGSEPYGENLQKIKRRLEAAKIVVGFNIKFDLHWIRKYCGLLSINTIHDCQLGEFILANQRLYQNENSLDLACNRYAIPGKLDVIEQEYWSQGINTTEVPESILREYLQQDLKCTYEVYKKQLPLLEQQNKEALFKLQCEDLLVLQEMEYNGLKFNEEKSRAKSIELTNRVEAIDVELRQLLSVTYCNFDSSDNVSVLLFGGFIKEPCIESYEFRYKDGSTRIKERKGVKLNRHTGLLPKPTNKNLEGADTKGLDDFEIDNLSASRQEQGKPPIQRIYSVDEEVLRTSKFPRRYYKVRDLLLERREIQKLVSTYYEGCIKIRENMQWPKDTLHGQFNQTIVRTGRLSSSKPNLQNQSGQIKDLFFSRYE